MKLITNLLILLCLITMNPSFSRAGNRLDIPDNNWRFWPDTAAIWQNDDIFLPGEFELDQLPINSPTGGWNMLNEKTGIPVTLPSTVEQYYWGKFGFRPYDNEYYFEQEDTQVKNGNFKGVSWWWQEIQIPKEYTNKKIILHIRGARLRAEVYLNQKLVGYHLITETAFNCDISKAVMPGAVNLLAIRITNPGGEMDWVDTRMHKWGKYQFHMGHGFGGLDRGIFITTHDPVYLKDVWVFNTPDIQSIRVRGSIENEASEAINGELYFEVTDPQNGKKLVSQKEKVKIAAGKKFEFETPLSCPKAEIWALDNPKLYQVRVSITGSSKKNKNKFKDAHHQTFGFRWFEADGIRKNAVLRLNGTRVRLVSAISWGFWGLNGLWPTPEFAEKEVQAAKAFGMNCIQFHRNIGKTEVLDAQDRLGLLRYMEPGGGQTALGEKFSLYANSPEDAIDTTGKNGEPKTFAEKYMEEKIIRMIRDHRNHPSLVMYAIQNEINPDLHNPRIFHLLKRMHTEDPSRIVVLKSGIPPRNQAWMQPYDDTIYLDRGNGYSGWWDQHTVGGPGVWQDPMYKGMNEFTHHSENDSEIVVWGEMLGAAVPDNHPAMIRQIEDNGNESYDLKDHQEILQAYNSFLDKWKFRQAFPTAEKLFLNIGDKCYDFWGRVIETARLSESNDFLVISGWESTAIENHSGLVDNLRNFKGNPELLKKRLEYLHPVIKPRSLVVALGQPDTLDLYLLNETGKPHPNSYRLTITDPDGIEIKAIPYALPEWHKDRFVYPIGTLVNTPELTKEGFYNLKLSATDNQAVFGEEKILVVDQFHGLTGNVSIGVLTHEPEFINELNNFPGVKAVAFKKSEAYDLLIASTRLLYGWRSVVDSTREIANTDDDRLFHTESWGYWRNLEYVFTDLPRGTAKVTLRLAEVTLKNPGDRIMNVAINGDTVLKDFDIVKTVGGPNITLDTSFVVNDPDGVVKITVPKLTVNYAKFSALKVEAGDSVIAINCGGDPYTDKNGLVWGVYGQKLNLDDDVLARVKTGTPLLVLPDGHEAADAYGKKLGQAGAFSYLGHVGNVRASWMGAWFFIREHPVFDGMPVNQAMKSYYQVPVSGSDGLLLEGPGVDVFVGYGRDHDRNIGAASFTTRLGKGKILWHSLPGMVTGLLQPGKGMQPVLLRRLLANSIKYLMN